MRAIIRKLVPRTLRNYFNRIKALFLTLKISQAHKQCVVDVETAIQPPMTEKPIENKDILDSKWPDTDPQLYVDIQNLVSNLSFDMESVQKQLVVYSYAHPEIYLAQKKIIDDVLEDAYSNGGCPDVFLFLSLAYSALLQKKIEHELNPCAEETLSPFVYGMQ